MRTAPLWFLAGAATAVIAEALLSPLFHATPAAASLEQMPLTSMPLADVSVALEGERNDAAQAGAESGAGAPTDAGSMQAAIARLEARLAAKGGSPIDWELLARSYDFMGRHEEAAQARQHKLPAPASAP